MSNAYKMTDYLKRRSKRREEELKYDFMPSILEIIEKPSNKAGSIIIYTIFSILVAAIIWASISRLEIIVMARGEIQPIGKLNVVQAVAGGTVREILVHEGQQVQEGDVLLNLDEQILDIDIESLQQQKKRCELQKLLYERILNGNSISGINVNIYEKEYRSAARTIIDYYKNFRDSLAEMALEKKNIDLELQISKSDLKRLQWYGPVSQIPAQELVIQQRELDLEKIELATEAEKTRTYHHIGTQITSLEQEIEKIENEIEKAVLALEYQEIKAPISGTIQKMEINTIGAALSAGQNVAVIVPSDAKLEMQCYIRNMDIADVQVGMEVKIKLDAYPFGQYGTMKGTLSYISPSSFTSEEQGSVYLAKITIHTEDNMDIALISGLSGSVEIQTGERTVLEYFLEPVTEGLQNALKEE